MTKSTGKYFCRSGTPQERFDARYIPEPNSGCWLWLAGGQKIGYGSITVNGRAERANRLSWLLHRGPIPEGLWVLHKCDNPFCVNPGHLFLGTHLDNMADMVRKGRHATKHGRGMTPEFAVRGQDHGNAKLTTAAAQEIINSKISASVLAQKFGVKERIIYAIRSGKRWAHLQRKEAIA